MNQLIFVGKISTHGFCLKKSELNILIEIFIFSYDMHCHMRSIRLLIFDGYMYARSLILSLSFSYTTCIEAVNSNSSPTVFEKNEKNFVFLRENAKNSPTNSCYALCKNEFI